MRRDLVTYELLRALLTYDPVTGIFRWINSAGRYGRIKAGTVAGGTHKVDGYHHISIGSKPRKTSHLAWLYMTGEFPSDEIDHINQIRDDNRWSNLRVVTTAQNLLNKTKYQNNTSGHTGVCWHKHSGKWMAKINIGRKRLTLCYSHDKDVCIEAYKEAKAMYHVIA